MYTRVMRLGLSRWNLPRKLLKERKMRTKVTELENAIKEFIEMRGDKIGMKTPECRAYKKTHENCGGCPYELGCSKRVHIMLTTFNPTTQDELIDSIISAETVAEVKAIPIPEPEYL